jgi:hypothetical protein
VLRLHFDPDPAALRERRLLDDWRTEERRRERLRREVG